MNIDLEVSNKFSTVINSEQVTLKYSFNSMAEKMNKKRREVVLETEVWSWGKGKQCQLGHGDMLDR